MLVPGDQAYPKNVGSIQIRIVALKTVWKKF